LWRGGKENGDRGFRGVSRRAVLRSKVRSTSIVGGRRAKKRRKKIREEKKEGGGKKKKEKHLRELPPSFAHPSRPAPFCNIFHSYRARGSYWGVLEEGKGGGDTRAFPSQSTSLSAFLQLSNLFPSNGEKRRKREGTFPEEKEKGREEEERKEANNLVKWPSRIRLIRSPELTPIQILPSLPAKAKKKGGKGGKEDD